MIRLLEWRGLLGASCLVCVSVCSVAQGAPVHGVIKLGEQYDAYGDASLANYYGYEKADSSLGDMRLIWQPQKGAWSSDIHLQAATHYGDAVALQNAMTALPGFSPVTPDQTNAMNLSRRVTDTNNQYTDVRLDRLSLAWSGNHAVVRVGRQALTWGVGLVFHPMDLFDPFAPNAIETDYKPGVDMLYGQWLFDSGSDVQGVVVPRRDAVSGDLDREASAAALRYHHAGTLDSALLVARDYGASVAGVSVSGNWQGKSWNVALVPTVQDGGNSFWSGVANISDAVTWWSKSVNMSLEYFHNGFGHGGDNYSLTDLSPALVARLSRGQVFVTGKDYLAGTLSVQWTPLWKVDNSLIVNAVDRSVLWFLHLNYSMTENSSLLAGGQVPVGSSGSEFGGLPVAPFSPIQLQSPASVFIRYEYYF